jgi:CubicO group peptidase (beta-lactamase class C family)
MLGGMSFDDAPPLISRRDALAAFAVAAAASLTSSAALGTPATTSAPATQPDLSAQITAAMRRVHDRYPMLPALAGALVGTDGPRGVGASGVRRAGANEPVTPADKFHLGSCTKALTATLIGQLLQAGKLKLDTPVVELLSSARDAVHEKAKSITVAHLLDHTAGLPANLLWGLFNGDVRGQRAAVAKQALAAAPLAEPGRTFAYSNVGYVLLGAIVEAIDDKPWEDALRDRLLKPLGMTSAGFGPPVDARAKVADQPWGHAGDPPKPTDDDNAPVLGPAGRLHASLGDWSKYAALVLRASAADTPEISRAAQASLLAPRPGQGYAGGWGIVQRGWAGGTALTHAGSNTHWTCVAWLAPAKGVALLAATNAAPAEATRALDAVAVELLRVGGLIPAR